MEKNLAEITVELVKTEIQEEVVKEYIETLDEIQKKLDELGEQIDSLLNQS